MKKKVITMMLALGMVVGSINPVFAEETDYSYLEDMSVKELRALDAAIHELLGDAPTADVEEETVAEMTETEETVQRTTEEFIEDIQASYQKRSEFTDKYSNSELNAMTYGELAYYYVDCAKQEKELYEKYKNATFEDLNIQYLCSQYIMGLKNQYDSIETWDKTQDWDKFYDVYHSGYYKRAYVIVELTDYYDLAFDKDAVAGMREETKALDSLDEAETRNNQVSHETVKEVQTLLHEIGFKCWNIDGVAGKRTVKAIKRFQEMYGFEVDGMIDDELIEQLKQVKADKGLVDEAEATAEKATETTQP